MNNGRERPIRRGMAAMLIAGQCTRHGVWRSRRPAAGGDPAPAGGMVHAGMHPPFSFPSCGKENGPCTVQKKRPLRRASVQWPSARRGSAYRCKRRFGLAFGHARVFCQVDTAVPWRMVPTSSGCKNAFDKLLFYCLALRRSQYFRHQCSTGSSFRAFRLPARGTPHP